MIRLIALLVLAGLVWETSGTRLHAALLPDRAGTYAEMQVPRPADAPPDRASHDYDPPEIGTRHVMTAGAFFGYGPALRREWVGMGPTDGPPRPAIVLLHGSARGGTSMLDMWQELAAREGLILIAPDALDRNWSMRADGPVFLAALLRDAARFHPIDSDQVYLMGHSAGAMHAMRVANIGLGPWRAVGLHAGVSTSHPAWNPVPVAAFVGARDPLFPVPTVQEALRTLSRNGHDVSLQVIADHDHWYYDAGPALAPVIWQAMRRD